MAVHITLKNGEQVKINDHVYCSPSWSVRDGTPYSVARIMEFLHKEGTTRGSTPAGGSSASAKGKGKENVGASTNGNNGNHSFTRVRLAWYYRPSDVSDRPVADSRLLLAAIYSEICDVSQLRSKCFVVHRDKITDLAGWKKRPDRFYFNRLFDPYIKKEFEVIQSNDVRNLPPNIREALTTRYEYVVAEKEIVPDLTDTLRQCETCSKWCPPPESVRCDRCKHYFHMGCVQPPLIAKPTRGYGWTCGPCSRAHEQAVEGHEVRHVTPVPKPKSNAPPARGRGRPRKDRTLAEKEENLPIKHFKMWPFRYFGLYTVAEDTLDPDDLIFPRTTTRVGPKYQVTIPAMSTARDPELEERGGDATIEVLSVVLRIPEDEVRELEARKARLTSKVEVSSSVDWLTEVVRRLSDAWLNDREFSTVNMSNPFRLEKWKKVETRYTDREWDDDEKAAFEDAILVHGAELRIVRDEVGTRTIADVVRYYGHWKNEKLGEENERRRQRGPSYKPETNQVSQIDIDSDEEGSVVKVSTKSNSSCGACRSRESKTWWKAPKGLASNVLCDSCGPSWRKYADLNHLRPMREETVAAKAKTGDKREGTPLAAAANKRIKTTGSSQATPPPGPSIPQLRCLACHKNGAIGKVLKCQLCGTRMHGGACGVLPDPGNAESWMCDLCANEKSGDPSVFTTDCVLCPRPRRDRKNKDPFPQPDSFLRACKPTEGQGWAHVACAVFTPELTFSDAARLRVVEGVSAIPHNRWSTRCALCNHAGGAVVQCGDCSKEFHIACAWSRGYKFGFEVQGLKNRKDNTAPITFNEHVGSLHAVIRCKDHDASKRPILDICETNESNETALQVYCKTYKQAPIKQSYALLRKARRLDHIIEEKDVPSPTNGHVSPPDAEPHCHRCRTVFSPFFHPVPRHNSSGSSSSPKYLCHRCHFEQEHPQANGHTELIATSS
ncbi:hypothetical protein FA95DRAFT_1590696 [Auriscalpium vulgare]|uniref:Uncharacterized protein n=1 Tax=Auriscalpium vulgare TaxID=40419 RepID=A0ACB8RF69_9AGAM|nr:hypothetical protein FA95DRAFT_1590696 [Auriscalpium vulgare]